MPRTKQQFDEMREAARQRIFDAGLKLFSHKGLAATSIQDIAAEAGVSVGLLYHYYPSKEDLFNELVETVVTSAAESIRALVSQEGMSPAEKIAAFAQEVVTDIKSGDTFSRYFLLMLLASLAERIPEKAAQVREKGYEPIDLFAGLIAEGQRLGQFRPGDAHELAIIFLAAVQSLAIYKVTMGERLIVPQPELLSGVLLK